MEITELSGLTVVTTEDVSFSYSTEAKDIRELEKKTVNPSFDWASNIGKVYSSDYLIYNHGDDNDLPTLIRDVVYNNYIAPGLLTKKTNLLWGVGPILYKKEIIDNTLTRVPVLDLEVLDWLESWDYERYLLKQMVDYNFIEGSYTRFNLNRGAKIGKGKIVDLEHISAKDGRLAVKRLKTENNNKFIPPTHCVISKGGFGSSYTGDEVEGIPLFDPKNPFKNPVSVLYSNLPAFGVDFYSLPDIYGTLEWIRRSTSIPLVLKAMSKNSINIKYHIESPSLFWKVKRDELIETCTLKQIKYQESMLEDYRKQLFKRISQVLTGDENTGKFWHTVKIYDEVGNDLVEAGWTITPIEQNIKDFVDSNIRISQRADHAVSSGIQLHSALGGVSETGKSDSGSEQLYAVKNHIGTNIAIPEMIVTEAINHALKANFPEKRIRLGFEHNMIKREQDITPSKRFKENETV